MKSIKLLKISLTNFKGLSRLELRLDGNLTTIAGDNATGKTTLFDAFCWCLFGRDSKGAKQFDLKTIDPATGEVIPRIPHEVTCVLDVDGETVTLTRRYEEKWTKKRGTTEETMTGHEETRLYNDVPLSVRDWGARIAALCPEETFRAITDPAWFCAQRTDTQRALLLRMAGEVKDEDIARGNEEFEGFLAEFNGKTIEDRRKEIAARKRRVKAETDTIPARIDERQREVSTLRAADTTAMAAKIAELKAEADKIEAEICKVDLSAYEVARTRAWAAVSKERELYHAAEAKAQEAKMAQEAKIATLRSDLKRVEDEQKRKQGWLDGLRKVKDDCARERARLIDEWRAIKAEKPITVDDETAVCPTCGQPLPAAMAAERKARLLGDWNASHARKLEENTRRGKEVRARMDKAEEDMKATSVEIEGLDKKGKELSAELEKATAEVMPTAKGIVEADPAYIKALEEAQRLEAEYEAAKVATRADDVNALHKRVDAARAQMAQMQAQIDETNKGIARGEDRVKELEAQLRAGRQELADIEREEMTATAFARAKAEEAEIRVNSLFHLVKFRLFEQQINGGEVETCEACVDGVPYSSLNNAMRIDAGLDIIDALCKVEGVAAPIFIDNAEAVNFILPTIGQQIRLRVADTRGLTVTEGGSIEVYKC